MEQKQVNPERIKKVGRSLIALFVLSLAYTFGVISINSKQTDHRSFLDQHYILGALIGAPALFFFIRICYNLIRCTEK
jgi:hypothetical protein